jgi:hypothetical protein
MNKKLSINKGLGNHRERDYYMTYNNRQHKGKKYILIILLAIIVISIPIIYIMYSSNEISEEKEDNISRNNNKQQVEEVKSLEVGFNDYLEVPIVNYELYEKTPKVKGIYVSAPTYTLKNKINSLIELANTTEINAFVIDVKNDSGRVTFDIDNEIVDEIKAEYKYIKDINGVLDTLYDNDIYPIARIVAFKDPWASKNVPEYAIKNKDGSLWVHKGISWLNPYDKGAWEYIVNIAKEAAKVGFKEIQFDYIRFEATRKLQDADFGANTDSKNRMDIIVHFIEYAMKELEPYDVKVSADVFGTIITSKVDARLIGQDYLMMAEKLDVICPMVYPSHYGKGFFGIPKNKHSDLYPYETIYGSMSDSNERYQELEGKKAAIVRPWLQAFTARYLDKIYGKGSHINYGGKEIRAQIQATYDAGLEEWILWNAGSNYSSDGLLQQ